MQPQRSLPIREPSIQTSAFYNLLDGPCNSRKMYTSFELRKSLLQSSTQGKIAPVSASAFSPFLNERDKLGRLLQAVSMH